VWRYLSVVWPRRLSVGWHGMIYILVILNQRRLSVELLALASAGGNGAVHLGSPVSVTRGEPNPIVARTSLGCRHQRPARQPACTGAPRMIRGCRLYPSFSDSLSEKNIAQKQQVMFHTHTIYALLVFMYIETDICFVCL
jgi:hypothetical protein